MKRKSLYCACALFALFVSISHVCAQEKEEEKEVQPFILSFMPDSMSFYYTYTQVYAHIVSISSQLLGDPTSAAMNDLWEELREVCKKNKFDGFIVSQIVFAKPFNEGKLICYGTFWKKKQK